MSKALVLLSGGQDSTTCLYWAKHRIAGVTEVHALSVHYGQKHVRELVAAREVAIMADCQSHHILSGMGLLLDGSSSALIDSETSGAEHELAVDGGEKDFEMPQGLPTSFVPGRNLLLLAAAAMRAGAIGASHIVTGVCQTDYSGYPDCRQVFIDAMNAAIVTAFPSMQRAPFIHTPLMYLTKRESLKLASELPGCWSALARTVTCYNGKHGGCKMCAACELRDRGFAEFGVLDPAKVEAFTDRQEGIA